MADAFIGQVQLTKPLPIVVVCSDGDRVPTTPDDAPTYKIFAPDAPSTVLTSGALSASDQASITGYRNKSLTITSALGFTQGKLYMIVIEYEISSQPYKEIQSFLVT